MQSLHIERDKEIYVGHNHLHVAQLYIGCTFVGNERSMSTFDHCKFINCKFKEEINDMRFTKCLIDDVCFDCMDSMIDIVDCDVIDCMFTDHPCNVNLENCYVNDCRFKGRHVITNCIGNLEKSSSN